MKQLYFKAGRRRDGALFRKGLSSTRFPRALAARPKCGRSKILKLFDLTGGYRPEAVGESGVT